MRIRRLNHSIYRVQYHIVWCTKYRRQWLKHYVRTELIKSVYQVLKANPAWYLHQINTADDHVHMRLEFPPDISIAQAVQKMKAHSSAHIRKTFKFIDKIYPDQGIWSRGYFASTIGLDEDMIGKYIQLQNDYDKGVDVTAEFE